MGRERPVLVVGAGLLGTSIGLALRRRGREVALTDISEDNLRVARGLGAASVDADAVRPGLVVVAVPPDRLGECIADALSRTSAVVTDVGSIKTRPLEEARSRVGAEALRRYVGSHPMAGSERSGPLAASAALFDGRPWAVTPHATSDPAGVSLVTELAEACGASPVSFTPGEHDEAVARTSHLPHLLASLVAGRLADAPDEHLALSGQGIRDVTRIAAGDPALWQQIVGGNAAALAALLRDVRDDLDTLLSALKDHDRGPVGLLLDRGVQGTTRIPGKHGTPTGATATVFVAIPDHPGELARLFADARDIGANIEDVRIDHDPARAYGLLELTVLADSADQLLGSLADRGWTAHR
ncbi:MAG TPA: prephenate dehydrogenase [Nocardioidaceae bacterium]|nr:prephenate dehydrogenase [Nocardioidaceae bacterium]